MFFVATIFWLLVCILLYTYMGYALVLWIFRRKRVGPKAGGEWPVVAHIIAAYNEEDFIADKVRNALAMDYPAGRMQVLVVADGSTDRTVEIASSFPGVKVMHQAAREGKVAALNRAVASVNEADVLVFSDANTMLNASAFREIVRHYADPAVGGVAGEKRVAAAGKVPGEAEGLYWKLESMLKQLESDFHTVAGAAGELLSLRRSLYDPVPEHVLLDDLYISLHVCRKGGVMRYEPGAVATEGPSLSIGDERLRRVRIGAGAFQSLSLFRDLLSIPRYGKLSFQFISHRVLRWTVCPLALAIIFILNLALATHGSLYLTLLCLQCAFYLLALIGSIRVRNGKGGFIFMLPYYFTFMNFSILAGLKRYLSGAQSVKWEKSKRAALR